MPSVRRGFEGFIQVILQFAGAKCESSSLLLTSCGGDTIPPA